MSALLRALRSIARPRRKLRRGRLVMLAAAVVVVPGAVYASGIAASQAAPARAQHPVIDTGFLYHELYFSSTHFITRVAGADGPPSNPADVNNLPQNYNGANEFYAWWKREMTNTDSAHMGPLGSFLTAKDHFEPCCSGTGNQTYPWQLDDATVTIPGQICPAQVVLVSGHNDSTPTSTSVASGAQTGSPTPMSRMHGGNWGNGSPFDADSGIALGMAELQGLLRWYHANGTYPTRTIKVGLFDAEETGLVGSGEYSQADTPTTLVGPAAAGATTINVASTNGIAAGSTIIVDQFGNHEAHTVSSVGTGARPATTLAAAAAAGATTILVTNGNNMTVGERISIDAGSNQEFDTIQSVGTPGPGGTTVTLATPLTLAHAAGAPAQDLGSGLVLTAGLTSAYPVGTQVTRTALGLIPDGPQGQYVMVANMDQNGIEYPAYHWGTQHYLNNIVGGGVGPWYTNVNAVPLSPNNIYPSTSAAWARIQNNLANETAFRTALSDAVQQAFAVLGQKYNFSIPLENPLRLDQVGSTPIDPSIQSAPAYLPGDIAKYSPVIDDALGRTDQVSFINRGIPGYGVVGAFDSSTNPAIGGNENPYPVSYTSKPTLNQYAGYDTSDDTIQHLNYWASGTTHGPGGVDQPSEELRRALELPATWTDYLIQKDAYGGASVKRHRPIAYFETDPAKPTTTNTVTFDASFSRTQRGTTGGLEYYWDFGDGTKLATTSPTVSHTFSSTSPHWYDVKLAVYDGRWSFYRQAVAVEFQPTLFPATPPAGEPAPPNTGPCGTLTAGEQSALESQARNAFGSL
jgi:PKD domain/Peptidase family M28